MELHEEEEGPFTVLADEVLTLAILARELDSGGAAEPDAVQEKLTPGATYQAVFARREGNLARIVVQVGEGDDRHYAPSFAVPVAIWRYLILRAAVRNGW